MIIGRNGGLDSQYYRKDIKKCTHKYIYLPADYQTFQSGATKVPHHSTWVFDRQGSQVVVISALFW